MALEIYWASGSPFAWRVLITAEVKSVPYVSKQLQFSKKEQKAADYLKLNPRGEVPAIRDGETVLTESVAIMTFLDRCFPDPPLFGSSPVEAGRVWSWISIAMYHLEPLSDRLVLPIYANAVQQETDDMQRAAEQLHSEWDSLEAVLSERNWLVGDAVSAADITVYTYLAFTLRIVGREIVKPLGLGFHPLGARYPSIETWCQQMEKLKGYDNVFPPHWRT